MFRTKAVAAAATMLGVAGFVSVDSALATRAGHEPASAEAPPAAIEAQSAAAPLPAVTEHPIPSWSVPAKTSDGGSATAQVIQVEIVRGELRLVPDEAVVELTRDGTGLVGTLPPVQVVDARGTHEGWTVWYRIVETPAGEPGVHIAPGKTSLVPSEPVVVHGTSDGLTSGRSGTGRGRFPLFSAARGAGGGTYEAGGRLRIHDTTARTAAVRVVFEVK